MGARTDPQQPPVERRSVLARWAWSLPVLLAVVLYLPALQGGYFWDDSILLKRHLVAFEGIRDLFVPPEIVRQWASNYYRPLLFGSFLVDRALYGAEGTVGFHLSAILLHAIATFFVWKLAQRLLRVEGDGPAGDAAALVTALLFAVHPIQSEGVAWMTTRSDTICAVFMLPSLLLALRFRDTASVAALVLGPALFLLALMGKEVALATLLLVPLLFRLVPSPQGGRQPGPLWLCMFLYAGAALFYFQLRSSAELSFGQTLPASVGELVGRFLSASSWYVWKVVVPPPQTVFVAELPGTAFTVTVLVGCLLLGILAVRAWRQGRSLPLLASFWFVLCLAPALLIAVRRLGETPVADRYLYLPSIALCLVAGDTFRRARANPKWRQLALLLVVSISLAYGYATFQRSLVWRSSLALWTEATERSPTAALPWYSLGLEHWRAGDHDRALSLYKRSLELENDLEGRSLAHNSIGMMLFEKELYDDAEEQFRGAIELRPGYETPYYGLGIVHLKRADRTGTDAAARKALLREASGFFEQAVERNTFYVRALYSRARAQEKLARAELSTGDKAQALEAFIGAVEAYEELQRRAANTSRGKSAAQFIEACNVEISNLAAEGY
jgi:tetratricopeptide (TPR) repeat protein